MSRFGCEELPYYVVIPFLSVNGLCVFVIAVLVTFVFTNFLCGKYARDPDSNGGFNKKLGLISTIATIFLLITSILLFFLLTLFQLCPSNRLNATYLKLILITPISMLCGYVSISASFFYRVVLAFENSIGDIKGARN